MRQPGPLCQVLYVACASRRIQASSCTLGDAEKPSSVTASSLCDLHLPTLLPTRASRTASFASPVPTCACDVAATTAHTPRWPRQTESCHLRLCEIPKRKSPRTLWLGSP